MVECIDAREKARAPVPGAELFHALAEAVDRCVFLKDRSSRYLLVNAAFRRWLGRSDSNIIGRGVFEVWPAAVAESLATDDRRVLAGERIENEEQRPNARELRTVKSVKLPVRDGQGRVVGILGCFADVTEEQHRTEERRQAQRLALVGRLAAGLTHDLNHLLTLAQGNASLLASGVPEDAPQRVQAERVETAIARAAQLTRRLVEFARADEPASESADIGTALTEVTSLFRAVLDRRITLHVWPGVGLPRVRVPLSQLTQIVLNLCLNARDAMPEGGRLAVQTDLVHVKQPGRAIMPDGPGHGQRGGAFVRLRVSDTGTGMTPAVRARVFDPWYTTKSNGTGSGLGLTIVQDVARRHGGWVECASAVGRGTCFSVYLPGVDSDATPLPAPLLSAAPPLPAVLLADNDACIIALCRTILEAHGYRVHAADDGKEAVAAYRRERAQIGLVLLDQNMLGMSGLDVLADLAMIDPQVRVVFMSGAPQEDVPAPLARNVRGFLHKPFRTVEMLDAVRNALVGA
jgi:PAS domain S-box-containing protein